MQSNGWAAVGRHTYTNFLSPGRLVCQVAISRYVRLDTLTRLRAGRHTTFANQKNKIRRYKRGLRRRQKNKIRRYQKGLRRRESNPGLMGESHVS